MNILKAIQRVVLSAMLLALPVHALAQTDARFTGTVLDQTGASVPGATVTIKNERTGEERVATANAQVRYVVANLKPSAYTIRASFGSFAPLEFTGMLLAAAQEFPLDLELRPAGLTETVTVEGRTNVVDMSSARIGVNVGERES